MAVTGEEEELSCQPGYYKKKLSADQLRHLGKPVWGTLHLAIGSKF